MSELVGPGAGWTPHKSEKETLEVLMLFLQENEILAV